ncbi:NADP-dependent oxidoreductase [Paraburkholderia acidicola]|uniref:NADP-dependent oxidoreductase n=1 Tax=Paraburkholderia acidicola TaxID=1912599 RepID=A0ABV1LWR2_9BURK
MPTVANLLNHQCLLAARPQGAIKDSDFKFSSASVAQPGPGQLLVQNRFISVDPAMRSWMNDGKSYMEAVSIGEVMRAAGAGYILRSEDPRFQVGDAVTGIVGVQEFSVLEAKDAVKVDTGAAPLASYLNLLGIPGFTAYFGLLEVGLAKAGETVLVSGAAGAVGAAVGQIARIKGCRVVGIAGGPEKCSYLTQTLGFDAAVDYKSPDARKLLAQACPDGVDVYFDNVGGKILDMALSRLRMRARVVICGAVSQYNNTERGEGPRNYMSLLMYRARMEGFVIFDYAPRYAEAQAQLSQWLASGELRSQEDVLDGLAAFPSALRRLFEGGNTGKMLLRLGTDAATT